MNIQFKKGVLELCVLSILEKKPCYGYELVQEISKNISISEGTIYPLLRRMTIEAHLATYLEESQEGPSRKYYQLTSQGLQRMESLKTEWFDFVHSVENILKEVNTNE